MHFISNAMPCMLNFYVLDTLQVDRRSGPEVLTVAAGYSVEPPQAAH